MKKTYTETTHPTLHTTEIIIYTVDVEEIKEKINQLKKETNIPTIFAYICDLYQEYWISGEIEEELYKYTDPKNEHHDIPPAEIWLNMGGVKDNPLLQYCYNVRQELIK